MSPWYRCTHFQMTMVPRPGKTVWNQSPTSQLWVSHQKFHFLFFVVNTMVCVFFLNWHYISEFGRINCTSAYEFIWRMCFLFSHIFKQARHYWQVKYLWWGNHSVDLLLLWGFFTSPDTENKIHQICVSGSMRGLLQFASVPSLPSFPSRLTVAWKPLWNLKSHLMGKINKQLIQAGATVQII